MIQFDIKNKRIFLKRTKYPGISSPETDLYLGAVVTVYSRQFKIVGYADDFTKKAFTQTHLEKTFCLLKPDAYTNSGKIIDIIEKSGFKVGNLRMLKLNEKEIYQLF